ncbi:MAG: hypothetical protein VZQ81_08650 [Succiniclasticum sp.]|nr:hypothetical protein [Succiniclasticum sp.]MEE3480070.1 hypothetical protein [Succiniclasticum sp.]
MACLILSVVPLSLALMLRDEGRAWQEVLYREQLEVIANSLMLRELAREKTEPLTDLRLPLGSLYPGSRKVGAYTRVQRYPPLGLRLLHASAADADGNAYTVHHLLMRVPELICRQASQAPLTVRGSVSGAETLAKNGVLYASSCGASFPEFKVDSFRNWVEGGFTSGNDMAKDGIPMRRMYVIRDRFTLKRNGIVTGTGILVFQRTGIFQDHIEFPDRVVIIAGEDLVLGEEVHFAKALILCEGTVYIRNGASVNGAVFANRVVVQGDTVKITKDTDVVRPFSTILFRRC